MRILLIGVNGTIGKAIAEALAPKHEIIGASRSKAPYHVDIADPGSIEALFARVGRVDAVVSAAGQAAFRALADLTDADFALSLGNKLMGQVNLVRRGFPSVNDGGSITLTSGILGQNPAPGSGAVSLVNAGLEGFTRAAALEASRGIRVNIVSPGWVAETLIAMKRDPSSGTPAAKVAQAYVRAVEGKMTGERISP
jgi:NAD(P)-dependent dehydrogenase (short-subunit alcohol dehydrogenase family)